MQKSASTSDQDRSVPSVCTAAILGGGVKALVGMSAHCQACRTSLELQRGRCPAAPRLGRPLLLAQSRRLDRASDPSLILLAATLEVRMGAQFPDDLPMGIVISAVSHEGLSVHLDRKPARFAIVDENGVVISSSWLVAREVESVCINAERERLKAAGLLKDLQKPK